MLSLPFINLRAVRCAVKGLVTQLISRLVGLVGMTSLRTLWRSVGLTTRIKGLLG